MLFDKLIGNNFAKEILRSIAKGNKLANSYIFYGPEGVGKKLFAIELAMSILCISDKDKPCDNCINCLKINKGTSESCKVISMSDIQKRKDNEEKYISAIRKLEQYLQFKTAKAEKRIIIIDDIEEYSTEALNAILKTLEEPPHNAIIILITNNIFTPPSTLVSRCQAIQFQPISETDITNFLCNKYSLSPDDASLIANLSEGSIGIAANIARDTSSEYKNTYITLQKSIASGNFYELKRLITKNSDSLDAKEKTKQIIKLIIFELRQHLLLKEANVKSIVSSIETLFSYLSYIDNNANTKLILENTLIETKQVIGR